VVQSDNVTEPYEDHAGLGSVVGEAHHALAIAERLHRPGVILPAQPGG
jgi:hypothetical protein